MQKPKKSLGQNFLKDKNIGIKIADSLSIKNKNIVEVGPGYGFLTDIILEKKPKNIILIEKDDYLYRYLIDKYKNNKIVSIYNNDILKFKFKFINNFNVVSNLPYNISSKVILKLFKHYKQIDEMVFMLQKEMAYKFDYNRIKINKYKFFNELTCYYNICFSINPSVFYPKPKVTSSVVKFKMKKKYINWKKAESFSKNIFMNRRKKILNNINLKKSLNKEIANKRIDQITFKELIKIYNTF